MRGGKHHRGRSTCRVAEDDRASGPDFVEDHPHVLDVLFEAWDLVWSNRIGKTGPALIKEDQPAIRGEAPQHSRDGRLLPDLLDMRQRAGAHPQQIWRSGPERLVGASKDRAMAGYASATGTDAGRHSARRAGTLSESRRKSLRSIAMTPVSFAARTLAVRRTAWLRAISPKCSPGPSRPSTRARSCLSMTSTSPSVIT